ELEAAFLRRGGKFARDLRRGGGVVDEDRALLHAGKGAVRAQGHLAQVVVVADAAHHELLALRGFARGRRARPAVFLHPGLRLRGGAVVDRDLVPTLVLEMPGHRITHDPEAEKRDFRHDLPPAPARAPMCRLAALRQPASVIARSAKAEATKQSRGSCVVVGWFASRPMAM